jgi:hypothetical protein
MIFIVPTSDPEPSLHLSHLFCLPSVVAKVGYLDELLRAYRGDFLTLFANPDGRRWYADFGLGAL